MKMRLTVEIIDKQGSGNGYVHALNVNCFTAPDMVKNAALRLTKKLLADERKGRK